METIGQMKASRLAIMTKHNYTYRSNFKLPPVEIGDLNPVSAS